MHHKIVTNDTYMLRCPSFGSTFSGRMKLLNELQDLLAESLKNVVTHDDEDDIMSELTLQVSSLHMYMYIFTCTCIYTYMYMYVYMYTYVDLIS